ncbi:MAG TPA: hypothetical protein VGE86_03645 [Thermoanaerobaculia bacterium]
MKAFAESLGRRNGAKAGANERAKAAVNRHAAVAVRAGVQVTLEVSLLRRFELAVQKKVSDPPNIVTDHAVSCLSRVGT